MKKLRHREQEVNPWNLNSGALAPAFQASWLPCAALQLRFCPSPMRPWAALPLAGVHAYQALPLLLVGQSGQHAEPCPQRSFVAVAIPCFRKHKSTADPCLVPASGIPLGNSSGDLLPDGQTAGGKNSYENIILCVCVCVCVCAHTRACSPGQSPTSVSSGEPGLASSGILASGEVRSGRSDLKPTSFCII